MATDARVFDEFVRTDPRPARYNEATYTFLNRRSGNAWQRIRDLIEDWFAHIEPAHRRDLGARLRSTSAVDFRSAYFELYCHAMFRCSGWSIELHPDLGATSRHPDLRVRRGLDVMYVEATTTAEPRADVAAESRLATVLDHINDNIEIGSFLLGLDVERIGPTSLAVNPLVVALRQWLDSLDADMLLERSHGLSLETLEWTTDGWAITFEAFPLAPDKRGPGGRIIGTTGPQGGIIDDVAPLRKRIREKAKAYGELEAPLLIAVDAVSSFVNDADFVATFYGTSAVRFYINGGPAAPPPTPITLPDGLFFGPEGGRRTHVSGVITTSMLCPWTVQSTVPTLWTHPRAARQVDPPSGLVRIAQLGPDGQHIEYINPTSTPAEVFGLPDGWPGFRPL